MFAPFMNHIKMYDILSLLTHLSVRVIESNTIFMQNKFCSIMIYKFPLNCFITATNPRELISPGDKYIVEDIGLVISTVTSEDAGDYICQASNRGGTKESQGRLIVASKN